MSLQLLLGAQGQQLQQTLAQNPLSALLAASMTGANPLNPLSGMSAPGGPTGQTGLPGLLSNLPGMGSSSSNDLAQQSQMLQAMSQLLMLNNPGNAPNPNLQSAALLQNQVSFKDLLYLFLHKNIYTIFSHLIFTIKSAYLFEFSFFFRCMHSLKPASITQ